jgi:hypothetical protein
MKTMITFLLLLSIYILQAQDKIFVHTVTSANIYGYASYINHPDLNGNPNAKLVFVHNFHPNNVENDNVTGLFYDSSEAKWMIFDEGADVLPIGSSYNILISQNGTVIDHVVTAANQGSFGDYTTVIDHPDLNYSNPGTYAILSNYYNPNSMYNNNNFGFYYDTTINKRGIFDENGSTIPIGVAFKVWIYSSASQIEGLIHVTDASNTSYAFTTIDHPLLNNNPDATFVFTHYFGELGTTAFVDSPLSVFYNGSHWHIYREDGVNMPTDLTFDIVIAPKWGLAVEESKIVDFKMYPNPTHNKLNLSAVNAIEAVSIYNMLGQEVLSANPSKTQVEINTSTLQSGAYVVKVKVEEQRGTYKLLKE